MTRKGWWHGIVVKINACHPGGMVQIPPPTEKFLLLSALNSISEPSEFVCYMLSIIYEARISPTLTSLLSQRRQFGLNCKKNIAMKITYKIVALFTENYPSLQQLI